MREVYLYGDLKKQFGPKYEFAADSIPEVISMLIANFPAFPKAIRNSHYRVVIGKTEKNGIELDTDEAAKMTLGEQAVHIVPVVEGSKSAGTQKIIAGIALIGLSMVPGGTMVGGAMSTTLWGSTTVGSMVASIGTGLLINGVASLIAPEQGATNKSYTMSGPTNTTKEGGIVPIAYGRVITGGTMISGALAISNKDEDSDGGLSEFEKFV